MVKDNAQNGVSVKVLVDVIIHGIMKPNRKPKAVISMNPITNMVQKDAHSMMSARDKELAQQEDGAKETVDVINNLTQNLLYKL